MKKIKKIFAAVMLCAALITGSGIMTISSAEGNELPIVEIPSKTDISGIRATIPYISYTYTGSEITPEPTLKVDGKKLVKGTDYDVSYSNNIEVGSLTATVTLTGKGNYKGTTSRQFTIKQNDISDNRATIPYLNYTYKGTVVSLLFFVLIIFPFSSLISSIKISFIALSNPLLFLTHKTSNVSSSVI